MQKILVIEDNQEVRENITEILELANYTVLNADNGKTGVETALREPFDLIVCDVMMPQLDGYGVLHLLNKHVSTRNIPFLFLTAKSEKADFRKGMALGADDYLTKPFDGNELLKAVEIRLQKSAAAKHHEASGVEGVTHWMEEAVRTGLIQPGMATNEVSDYQKKQVIYAEGKKSRMLYYIVQGTVKIFKENQDGKELITAILHPGDFIGYTSILEDIPYRESAEMLEDGSLMMIPAADFRSLINTNSAIAREFIRLIARNILGKEEDLLNLAYNSLRKKVAYGLVQQIDHARANASLPVLNLSRKEMAQSVGVATESFIRTVADFKVEKLLDIVDGKILILNEEKLRCLPN